MGFCSAPRLAMAAARGGGGGGVSIGAPNTTINVHGDALDDDAFGGAKGAVLAIWRQRGKPRGVLNRRVACRTKEALMIVFCRKQY
jgi:hypothetical protein